MRNGWPQRLEQPLGQRDDAAVGARGLGQDRELVAAEPRDDVVRAAVLLDAARHRDQELVADGVAQAVVDQLEAVEVEEHHAEVARRVGVARARAPARAARGSGAGWAGRSGCRGRRCAAARLRLRRRARDVLHLQDQARRDRVRCSEKKLPCDRRPDVVAVAVAQAAARPRTRRPRCAFSARQAIVQQRRRRRRRRSR